MRKAVLHIIFLSLLLTTAMAHAFASPQSDVKAATIEKAAKSNFITSDSGLYKNDVLDIDDYDECDFDDHSSTLKERQLNAIGTFIAAKMLVANMVSKPSFKGNYTYNNFSRIPRYNYITLRVLRI